MELISPRRFDTHDTTLGELFIGDYRQCLTLEDTHRHEKIPKKTRIGAGRYEIKLRKSSPMAKKYRDKYGTDGMIWLQNVPEFEHVYIHIGVDRKSTDGCIIVGNTLYMETKNGVLVPRLWHSSKAYLDLHPKIVKALKTERVFITIIDN